MFYLNITGDEGEKKEGREGCGVCEWKRAREGVRERLREGNNGLKR